MARINALAAPVIGRPRDETGRLVGGAPDWPLVATIVALTLIGLVFVFSSSFAVGERLYDHKPIGSDIEELAKT